MKLRPMKKQLGKPGNRKMFNTNTGEKLMEVRSGSGKSRYLEALYKTSKGDYFIHGRGGPLTRWNDREDIIEVSMRQANFWLRKHGVTA
jgi:hypothetical protein